jgi:hypothetical protein
MAKTEMTFWHLRSLKQDRIGSRRIGAAQTWLPIGKYANDHPKPATNHKYDRARLYLEWARLLAPDRQSMGYIYMPEHEIQVMQRDVAKSGSSWFFRWRRGPKEG